MRIRKIREAAEDIFSGRPILAAYLFGSLAESKEGKRSDIDIALLMEKTPEKFLELEIASELESKLEMDRDVDVRIINNTSLLFIHQVLKNGKRIYTGDKRKTAQFEENFYKEYLDLKPLIKEYNRIRMKRLSR